MKVMDFVKQFLAGNLDKSKILHLALEGVNTSLLQESKEEKSIVIILARRAIGSTKNPVIFQKFTQRGTQLITLNSFLLSDLIEGKDIKIALNMIEIAKKDFKTNQIIEQANEQINLVLEEREIESGSNKILSLMPTDKGLHFCIYDFSNNLPTGTGEVISLQNMF